MKPRTLGLGMATLTALCWAILAILLKLALRTFSSEMIVWLRLALAFLILFVIFAFKRRPWLRILRKPPWLGVLAGVLIAINYYGFMKGIELTSASNSQILIQLAPLSFAASSMLLFREYPTWRQSLGMALALAGFGFFFWDQILLSVNDLERFQRGNLWLLVAVFSWTGFALIQKKLLKIYAPQQFNLLLYGVAALLFLPWVRTEQVVAAHGWDLLLIVFLAINTVVAYGALSEALLRIPASHVSMIIAVNPLLTLFLMDLLTRMEVEWIKGEPIGWRGVVGALFVVVGVISTVASPLRLSTEGSSLKIAQ